MTNTGVTTISGDLGVSPGIAVTGFPPGVVINGTIHVADGVASGAQNDATTAYNDARDRPSSGPAPSDLGTHVFLPGVYTGDTLSLTGTTVLDGNGDPGAVFIFQAATTLITSPNSAVALINGANACNVYWQVGSSATLGTNTVFAGTVLASASITSNTNAFVTGRLLASTGAVSLDTNTIVIPNCAAVPIVTVTATGPTTTVSGPTETVAGPTTTVSGPTTTVSGPTTTVSGPTETVAGPTTTVAGVTETVTGPTVTLPGTTTTVSGPTVTLPGTTTTVSGPTVTVAGPTTTVAGSTATVTEALTTVTGPTVTLPGPTTTVSGPTSTVAGPATTLPGTTVTVTSQLAPTLTVTVTANGSATGSETGVGTGSASAAATGSSTAEAVVPVIGQTPGSGLAFTGPRTTLPLLAAGLLITGGTLLVFLTARSSRRSRL